MLLSILIIFLVILIYTTYKRKKATASAEKNFSDFWEKEQASNLTRKKDLSSLDYIQIPLEKLPLGKYPDEGFDDFERELRELSSQPICNLNNITNTDLKMQYGPANLEYLTACDNHYSTLVTLLANYGESMYNHFHNEDARIILEYAVSLKSDIAKSYVTLANIYAESGRTEHLLQLKKQAEALTSIRKNSILAKLSNYIPQGQADAEAPSTTGDTDTPPVSFTITEKDN